MGSLACALLSACVYARASGRLKYVCAHANQTRSTLTGDKPKPTVPPYTLNDWFTIQVMEAVVNIALPSVAIVGCKPRGLLTIAFVQLIAGIVKSVVMFAYNVYERSKENVNNDVVTNNIFHGV